MKKKKNKIKNKKNTLKIFLGFFTLILAIYAVYQVMNLLINPTNIVTVENGKISSEIQAEGFIIREEKVLKGENYKNGISQIKTEGEKVAKGENVFRYYTKDEDSLTDKIKELDNKIAEAQSTENSLFSSDLKVIENEIENKISEMYRVNDIHKIQEYKSEVESLSKKKTQIIGELSPSGSYLKNLIQKRSEYENKLNSGSEYMKAETSGMVSYKVDNIEEILNSDSIEDLNMEQLNNLNVKTGQIISNSGECGKIVNNYYCYIAAIVNKNNADKLTEGKSVKLRIINGDEVSAKIEKIKEDNNKYIIIFRINKDVEELIDYRKINIDIILWDYTGLKVPNSSILEEGGLNYVVRNRAGYRDKILVKVEKQNETYSIIEDYTTEELKELGWSTIDIVNNKSIGVYDEILVDPEK